MIPANAVTAWGVEHPWPTREQVEQDLLLSQAICAIAQDDYLSHELVFRGGTALHKLHLRTPYRYSEDLDYVRSSATGIGPLTLALCRLGADLGYTVNTRVGQHPKVSWRTTASTGVPLRIKIEVNTHERSPALPNDRKAATCSTCGSPSTNSACPHRRSCRPSRPTDPTGSPRHARDNLAKKLQDPLFRNDLGPLITTWPENYNLEAAAIQISELLLDHLDD